MSAMKVAESDCRETMEALLLEDLDEDMLGRALWCWLGAVKDYGDLAVNSRDLANQSWFAQEAIWRENKAIETIFKMQHPDVD